MVNNSFRPSDVLFSPLWLCWCCKFFSSAHKYAQAIDLYTKAIGVNSQNAVYWANRSFAHIKLEEYGSAIQDASMAIEVDPRYSKAWFAPWIPIATLHLITFNHVLWCIFFFNFKNRVITGEVLLILPWESSKTHLKIFSRCFLFFSTPTVFLFNRFEESPWSFTYSKQLNVDFLNFLLEKENHANM